MSRTKQELFDDYFTPADENDPAVDFCGYAEWCEAVELPALSDEPPVWLARAVERGRNRPAPWDEPEGDDGGDEPRCICGEPLPDPAATLCQDCVNDLLEDLSGDEANHVN